MGLNNLYRNPIYRTEKPFPIEFYRKFMFFPDPVLNWNKIDVFVPGRLAGDIIQGNVNVRVSQPCHPAQADQRGSQSIPDTRDTRDKL